MTASFRDVGIDRPIFFLGMPRSGTTVVFEVFAAHEEVGWPSQYLERAPSRPALAFISRTTDLSPKLRRTVGRSDLRRSWIERFKVGPSEAYAMWRRCCGERFLYDYLLGVEASASERGCISSTVSKILRYQGKSRFAAKLTGPARIAYLSSLFPDARFVHVIRDGRAVVHSLLNVSFWEKGGRMHEPAWEGGLGRADIADWEQNDRSPLSLAAVQWRRVVTSAREEAARLAPDRYGEVHYERFVATPDQVLDELARFCELAPSARATEFLRTRVELRDMNFQWRERLPEDDLRTLNGLLGEQLVQLGYGLEPPRPPSGGPGVVRPFAGVS
jgi:hypothetical protein